MVIFGGDFAPYGPQNPHWLARVPLRLRSSHFASRGRTRVAGKQRRAQSLGTSAAPQGSPRWVLNTNFGDQLLARPRGGGFSQREHRRRCFPGRRAGAWPDPKCAGGECSGGAIKCVPRRKFVGESRPLGRREPSGSVKWAVAACVIEVSSVNILIAVELAHVLWTPEWRLT